MIFILDRSGKVIGFLKNGGGVEEAPPFFEDILTQDLATGAETYQFTTIDKNLVSQYLVVGNYVAFKDEQGSYKLFQIVQTETRHEEVIYITVYAECAGLELLNKVFRKRKMTACTLKRFIETITSETGWDKGSLFLSDKSLDLEIEDGSVYEVLQNNISKFGGEIEFRVEIRNGQITGKYIDIPYQRGRVTGKRFTFGRDIESIVRKIDSTDMFTALIGVGKDGISFRDVTVEGIDKPLGQDYVVDEEAYKLYNNRGYHLMGLFQYETTSPEELLLQTYKHLQTVKMPKVEYEVEVALLDKILGSESDKIQLGDTVAIVDNAFNPPIHLMARITKLETSKTDTQANKCTLANFIEVRSNITDEMRRLASQLEGYVDSSIGSRFPINGNDIVNGAIGGNHIIRDSITTDHLKAGLVEAVTGKFEELEAKDATIESLVADKADITDLDAIHADIQNLVAKDAHLENAFIDKATILEADIKKLKADKAEIVELEAVKGDITHLKSEVAEIDLIKGDLAEIENLVGGNISSENIQTGGITGDRLNMSTIFVDDANIIKINANKINAGIINASKVALASEDGGMKLLGNTQQFLDKEGNIRIQLGRDAKGDFDFYILDDSGNILFNTRGITGNAIENGLIKNEMISDGAVGGEKINWDSFTTEFNKETNTHSINASKVILDGTNQSLTVKFDKLESTMGEIEDGLKAVEFTKKMCLYYGYPIAINKAWNVNGAVNIYKNYDIVVFGDNYNKKDHEAHADTVKIIDKLRTDYPEIEVFGYVPCAFKGGTKNLSTEEIKELIDLWADIGVTGIFYDEFGFDYWNTRERQNELVLHGKSHGLNAFVNSWEDTYVFSTKPMTISWMPDFEPNPNGLAPVVDENDYSLYEHLFFQSYTGTQYASNPWRVYKAYDYYNKVQEEYGMTWFEKFGTRTISLDGIHSTLEIEKRKELMTMALLGAKTLNVDGVGFGDENWGSRGTFYEWDYPQYALRENGKHTVKTTFDGVPVAYEANINGINLKLTWNNGIADKVELDTGERNIKVDEEIVTDAWLTQASIIKSHTTAINFINGQIDTIISDTTIEKDGETVKLKDEYNKTVLTVDSMKSTMSAQQTIIDEHTGKITDTSNKTNELSRDLESMVSRITATETSVQQAKDDITGVNSEVQNAKSQISEINQNLSGITARVGETEKTVTAHTGEINSVNTKINSANSEINVLKDKISTKVSQSDIDRTVQEIEIGGRNILSSLNIENGNLSGSDGSITNGDFTNFFRTKSYINVTANKSLSMRINKPKGGTCVIEKIIAYAESGYLSTHTINQTSTIFIVPPSCTKIKIVFVIEGAFASDLVEKYEIMVEHSTKFSNYTPAPEDVDHLVADSIKVVDEKISEVSSELTQTKDSIQASIGSLESKTNNLESNLDGKATKGELTEVDRKVTTITADLNGVTQRVEATESKTESLQTEVNGKATKTEVNQINNKVSTLTTDLNGITARVGATETKTQSLEEEVDGKATKSELTTTNNKVTSIEATMSGITQRVEATESQVEVIDGKVEGALTKSAFTEFKQEYDNFQWTVKKDIGGQNLIKNSGFLSGSDHYYSTEYEWNGSASSIAVWYDSNPWVINGTRALCIMGSNSTSGSYGVRQDQIKLKPNTTYTLSGFASTHRGKWRISLAQNDWAWIASAKGVSVGGKDPNMWDKFSVTFTTGGASDYLDNCKLDLMLEEAGNNAHVWFTSLVLVEGSIAQKWQPNPHELYSANMKLDSNGLTCEFEDGTYSKMGRDGFKYYNAGTGFTHHAICYATSFGIPAGNPGRTSIKLPIEFTKRFSSLRWTVALRGYYYSTSGNFFVSHLHCTGARSYIWDDGHVWCDIEGVCRLQNGNNYQDQQYRDLTAMLIAIC